MTADCTTAANSTMFTIAGPQRLCLAVCWKWMQQLRLGQALNGVELLVPSPCRLGMTGRGILCASEEEAMTGGRRRPCILNDAS